MSPDWFITWLRMLCATCYFTLPQVVEVLRRFPLQLAFQVSAPTLPFSAAALALILPFAARHELCLPGWHDALRRVTPRLPPCRTARTDPKNILK